MKLMNMNKETYEALEETIKKTRTLLDYKYKARKRLSQEELWEKATALRDIVTLETWAKEQK